MCKVRPIKQAHHSTRVGKRHTRRDQTAPTVTVRRDTKENNEPAELSILCRQPAGTRGAQSEVSTKNLGQSTHSSNLGQYRTPLSVVSRRPPTSDQGHNPPNKEQRYRKTSSATNTWTCESYLLTKESSKSSKVAAQEGTQKEVPQGRRKKKKSAASSRENREKTSKHWCEHLRKKTQTPGSNLQKISSSNSFSKRHLK